VQGVLLQQRFHLLRQVGKGGFGVIYQAVDTHFGNRLVAIKQLNQKSIAAQKYTAASEAFKREALVLAHLVHPNLPRVYDFFCEGGCWYLVMDFIEGETLEAYLYRMGGKLRLEQVLQIGIRLCSVLGFLHTRPSPIIYRDLKPTNIMLTREGHLYLIDFGIARFFKPGQAQDTAVFGTPGYTAPEQYGQAQTTPSADIYSLGAMLHRLLTGQNPSETPFTLRLCTWEISHLLLISGT
jgi:serine/threonine protein kinase